MRIFTILLNEIHAWSESADFQIRCLLQISLFFFKKRRFHKTLRNIDSINIETQPPSLTSTCG